MGERDVHTTGVHELHMKKPSVKKCKSWIKTDTTFIRKHFEKNRNSESSSISPLLPRHAIPEDFSSCQHKQGAVQLQTLGSLNISQNQHGNPQNFLLNTQ